MIRALPGRALWSTIKTPHYRSMSKIWGSRFYDFCISQDSIPYCERRFKKLPIIAQVDNSSVNS